MDDEIEAIRELLADANKMVTREGKRSKRKEFQS